MYKIVTIHGITIDICQTLELATQVVKVGYSSFRCVPAKIVKIVG